MPAESPAKDAQNVAGTAKGAYDAAKSAKTAIQAASTVAKGASGPAGWIALAAQAAPFLKKNWKKIVGGIGGGIGALLALLYLKFAGLVAGLAFGAISGLPLLLVPGAGPFLYGGYVAYWGYKGFTDPIGTIHLATHPWEPITSAFNGVKNFISDTFSSGSGTVISAGSATTGAIGGGISTASSWATGAISSAWNASLGALGNSLGWALGKAGNLFGALGSIGSTEAATLTTFSVPTAIGTVVVGGTLVGVVTATSFSTPEGDAKLNVQGDNSFFTITKTANPTRMDDPGTDITYTITLTAKELPLKEILVADIARVQGETLNETFTTDKNGVSFAIIPCPPTIPANGSCTHTFTVVTQPGWDDSIVINTVQVRATPEGGSAQIDSTTVTTIIGDPPASCPRGWSNTGFLTQGPMGSTSHAPGTYSSTDPGYEAWDIATPLGTKVYATVEGVVVEDRIANGSALDQRIGIAASGCGELKTVHYWHLSARNVHQGQFVKFGDLVGLSGHRAPHVHYMFNQSGDRSFPIDDPQYVGYPGDPPLPPETCTGDCNYIITRAP